VTARERAIRAVSAVKKKVNEMVQSNLQKVEIRVSNVSLQFEDGDSSFGHGHIVAGLRVGRMQAHFEREKFLTLDVSRVGVHMDVAPEHLPSPPSRMRCFLEKHPKDIVEELKRLDIVDSRAKDFLNLCRKMDGAAPCESLKQLQYRHIYIYTYPHMFWVNQTQRLSVF
jgi:hypothetical protein